jgi:hypothetical protein
MRYVLHIDGRNYSLHKDAFKEILRRHGLKWKGTFERPWWGSSAERVEANFERDPERDITTAATLIWIGPRASRLLEELEAWVLGLGGHAERQEGGGRLAEGRQELRFWDFLNKPDETYLRREGRPEKWIQLDLEEWKRRRREKEQELEG